MSAAPLLSIGVPVYNGERYLAEALESALRQNYSNLEVLIADNASSDATPAICRRFDADPRVRYERSAHTIDPIANFRRALSMARGRYFTWLAHDDVLTSPAYAPTMVRELESHSDALLCASALELFRDEDPDARSVLSYARFTTGEPWRVARRALFRWPPGEWETLFYGVYRRDILERHFDENPAFQFPLQKLAFAGRFIVVPAALRAYRLHEDSVGRQRVTKSAFALFVEGVSLKRQLLLTALRAPAPFVDRIPPAAVSISNFFRDHVAWAYPVGRQIAALQAELTMLAAAADERVALVRRLDAELQRIPAPAGDSIERSSSLANSAGVRPPARRSRWPNPFRSPDSADVDYLKDLTTRVADARHTCDELLAAIEARDRELKTIRERADGHH